MDKYKYDIVEPMGDLNEDLDFLAGKFVNLYLRSWNDDKRKVYDNKPFDLNMQAFSQMWLNKTLRIFMAYQDENPVGFLVGILFRPLPYQANVFQIEDWFTGGDREMEKGLFNYVFQAIRFIGCDEIWIAHKADHIVDIPPPWNERNTFRLHRYTKEKERI